MIIACNAMRPQWEVPCTKTGAAVEIHGTIEAVLLAECLIAHHLPEKRGVNTMQPTHATTYLHTISNGRGGNLTVWPMQIFHLHHAH